MVSKSEKDVIVLSVEEPEQFNKRQTQENWTYAILFQNFHLGYHYRLHDDDKEIKIESVSIEDASNIHSSRFK